MKVIEEYLNIFKYHIHGIVDKLLKNNKNRVIIQNINTLTKDTINYLSLKESSWLVRMNRHLISYYL
jgi:hypothetical protein